MIMSNLLVCGTSLKKTTLISSLPTSVITNTNGLVVGINCNCAYKTWSNSWLKKWILIFIVTILSLTRLFTCIIFDLASWWTDINLEVCTLEFIFVSWLLQMEGRTSSVSIFMTIRISADVVRWNGLVTTHFGPIWAFLADATSNVTRVLYTLWVSTDLVYVLALGMLVTMVTLINNYVVILTASNILIDYSRL